MNMKHIYRELEKTSTSSRIHKFTVIVENDIKEIYEKDFFVAKINLKNKTFYTKYKLMGTVILFSRYLKSLGYRCVKSAEDITPSSHIYMSTSIEIVDLA